MTISKVGRPSIENSEVPPHIEEALLHKSRGKTWADSATAVGLKKYQTILKSRCVLVRHKKIPAKIPEKWKCPKLVFVR